MQSLIQIVGTKPKEDRLPDYGNLNLPAYSKFLEESSIQFWKKYDDFKNAEKQLIKLEDNQYSLKDFSKVKLIGVGTFGHVYLVKNNQTGDFQAMKAILKKTVVDFGQVNNTRTEKLVLQCTNCPFHLQLDFFFKDNSYLYFVVPFIKGGELYHQLHNQRKFDEITAMFYLGQVILAIEYLHYLNIVYRDIKPENILIDHTGYIKITDFGFCKHLSPGHERTYTLCGTPDYFAPEVIRNEGYGKSVDWWAVGVLAYELTTGLPPFRESNEKNKFKTILSGTYDFPEFLSNDLRDVIGNALQVDITRRFGNMKRGVDDFKRHRWFRPLNWQSVVCRKAVPPFIPITEGADDTRNFKTMVYKSLKIADKLEFGEDFADF